MTPDPSFVKDLRAYDASLRLRWGLHTERWIIERHLPPRNPQWIAERPNPFGKGPRAQDLWAGWREGYVHVLSVDRALLNWQTVAPELAAADVQQAGSWAALNRKLDEAEAQWEAGLDREREGWVEAATYEAYDHMAYQEKRRVSLYTPPERVEQHEGFVIKDRRVRT